MTTRRRMSRLAVAFISIGMLAVGATVCFAWLQEKSKQAIVTNAFHDPNAIAAHRNYVSANNYFAQSGLPSNNPNDNRVAGTVRYTLPREQQSLVAMLTSAPEGGNTLDKAKTRDQLVALVEQELDARLKSQGEELDLLEKRVADARSKLAQRTERKKEIVERRIAELLSEPDELAWNSEPNMRANTPTNIRVNANAPGSGWPAPNTVQSQLDARIPFGMSKNGLSSNAPVSRGSNLQKASVEPAMPSQEFPTPAEASGSITNSALSSESKTSPRLALTVDSLAVEAIEIEADLEELDGLTAAGKNDAIQRLSLKKRMKQAELKLSAVKQRTENDLASISANLELAELEHSQSTRKYQEGNEMIAKGAISRSDVTELELEVQRSRHKVKSYEQEMMSSKDKLKEVEERIQSLRAKLDSALSVSPEAKY